MILQQGPLPDLKPVTHTPGGCWCSLPQDHKAILLVNTASHTQEHPKALTNASQKARFTYLSKQSVKKLHVLKLQSCKNIYAHRTKIRREGTSMEMFVLVSDCGNCFLFNTVFTIVTLFKKLKTPEFCLERILLGSS